MKIRSETLLVRQFHLLLVTAPFTRFRFAGSPFITKGLNLHYFPQMSFRQPPFGVAPNRFWGTQIILGSSKPTYNRLAINIPCQVCFQDTSHSIFSFCLNPYSQTCYLKGKTTGNTFAICYLDQYLLHFTLIFHAENLIFFL